MTRPSVDLAAFDNSWYHPGSSALSRVLWFFIGLPLLRSSLPGSRWRVLLLRLFDARIGRGVVIKPGVRVKYPWHLTMGDHCWIGEDVWIDNLAPVELRNDVCISQRAYLCTGNHDWSDPAFGLIVKPIALGHGSWVGAGALVCPGVELGDGAIAAAGGVVTRNIPAWEIHAGNPAGFMRQRELHDAQRRSQMEKGQ